MPQEERNQTLEEVFRDGTLFDGLSTDSQPEPVANAGQDAGQTAGSAQEGAPQTVQPEAVPQMAQEANVPADTPQTAQSSAVGVMGNPQPTQPDAASVLSLLIPAFRQMQTENAQLKQSITQQSEATKAQLEDSLEPPTLDIDGMMYDDDATRQRKQSEYNTAMLDYQRKMLMKEMQPMMDSYREQQQAQALNGAVANLHNLPGVGSRFDDVAADIPQTIKSIPALSSMPPNEAVVLAALIAKGRAASNAQAKTPEQMADEVYSNPEVMKLLELKRSQALQANQTIPPMSASQGAMSAAPVNVDHKPETVQDAWGELEQMLRRR